MDVPNTPRRKIVALEYEMTCASCGRQTTFGLPTFSVKPMCLVCCRFDHLEFLPSGTATLSRRAAQASRLSVIVERKNAFRMRYERHGVLVEPAAIERAARECLSDVRPPARRTNPRQEVRDAADARFQAELAAAIRAQFPGCPVERAEAIAMHRAATSRHDRDRVVDADAARAAVAASVLHVDTDYDELLASRIGRDVAQLRVQQRVDDGIVAWRDGATLLDG